MRYSLAYSKVTLWVNSLLQAFSNNFNKMTLNTSFNCQVPTIVSYLTQTLQKVSACCLVETRAFLVSV